MGLGGIGISELLVILVIVVLLFGTKKLGNIGKDLGEAVKSFKDAMSDSKAEEHEWSKTRQMEQHEAATDAMPQEATKTRQT